MEKYDAIIVGGGILGLSIGYYLSKKKKILILEKNYIGSGSTGRCIGGIRQQFSTPGTIKLAMESVRLFKEMEKEFGFSVEYAQTGYLLLAFTDDEVKIFKKNIELQKSFGIKVDFIEPEDIKKLVPHMNTDGVIGGAYSNEDGQAYPFLVLKGYFKGVINNGGEIRMNVEVETLLEEGGKIKGVKLKDESIIESEIIINAAGPWAGDLSMTIDYPLPFAPERHEAFITTRLNKFFDPMLVDYRKDGCYFNQRLNGQIIGCYTPKPNHPGKSTDESFEFLYEMSRRAVRLVPELKKAQVLRQWAGSYTMTPDGSPIIDKTDIEGYFIAGGMSGHGFMLGPGTGKLLADYIIGNKFSFDMSEFSMKREFKGEELLK
jgi:sarcosine oxidase subunit beta